MLNYQLIHMLNETGVRENSVEEHVYNLPQIQELIVAQVNELPEVFAECKNDMLDVIKNGDDNVLKSSHGSVNMAFSKWSSAITLLQSAVAYETARYDEQKEHKLGLAKSAVNDAKETYKL